MNELKQLEAQRDDEIEIDLGEIFHLLLNKLWVIILCFIVGGVIAPLFYLAIGGPLLGWLYKAVNTMDSMVGYKNDRYLHFGRAAAKLDDLVNLIPSRLAALLLIVSAYLLRYDGKNRRNHKSPNSAQTESACAGALGLRLAGDAWYFGKLVPKPYIGDEIHPIEPQDIRRVNRLMYGAAGIMGLLALVMRAVILF
mgnify:CR=1 FL=1